MKEILLIAQPQNDYELLDSGDGEKLERFGVVTLRRPDPQALWHKQLPEKKWGSVHAVFTKSARGGSWNVVRPLPKPWSIECSGIQFILKLSSFKHVGIFPEQAPQWGWLTEQVRIAGRPQSVLHLFGYTGGATIAAALGGGSVVHVDSSKVAVGWARENAALNKLSESPTRWILDDAIAFVRREIKRGKQYDGIVMDPPSFGHGPSGELWSIEKHLPELLTECRRLMSPQFRFFLMSGYAAGYSPLAYANLASEFTAGLGGAIEYGELAIAEKLSSRLLPSGIFVRWSALR